MNQKKRRNHYIPRLLLNRFASRKAGDTKWIWQISTDGRATEISTRDAGVGSVFYGKPDSGVEEGLAKIESEFGIALARIDAGAPPSAHKDVLRQFVYFLFIRTLALREHFIDSTRRTMGKMAETVSQDRVSKAAKRELEQSFGELILEASAQLPPLQAQFARALVANPQALEALKCMVVEQTESGEPAVLMKRMLDSLTEHPAMVRSAEEGQIRGLARLLDTAQVPDSFSPASWRVFGASQGKLVLGDCCAFAWSNDGRYGSLLRFANEWSAVFLPLSPVQLLVGTRDEYCPVIDHEQLNGMSAGLSRRYLYSSQVTEAVLSLALTIGTAPALISDGEVDEIMTDVWKDLD